MLSDEVNRVNKDDRVPSSGYSKEEELKLLTEFKSGDLESQKIIFNLFESYTKSLCKRYFIRGASLEDLQQICRIGIVNAVFSYDPSQGDFVYFTCMVMKRHVLTGVKTANRGKVTVHLGASSLHISSEDREEYLLDLVVDQSMLSNPEDFVVQQEVIKSILANLKAFLSPLEYAMYLAQVDGYSFAEIASDLGVSEKSVDNGLCRAKKKLIKNKNKFLQK